MTIKEVCTYMYLQLECPIIQSEIPLYAIVMDKMYFVARSNAWCFSSRYHGDLKDCGEQYCMQ